MLHRIAREVDRTNVVAVDEGGTLELVVELLEKLVQLGGLGHAVGHSTILGLSAGARKDMLSLGGPGDDVGAQEYCITESEAACVGAASSVSVGVDQKL